MTPLVVLKGAESEKLVLDLAVWWFPKGSCYVIVMPDKDETKFKVAERSLGPLGCI